MLDFDGMPEANRAAAREKFGQYFRRRWHSDAIVKDDNSRPQLRQALKAWREGGYNEREHAEALTEALAAAPELGLPAFHISRGRSPELGETLDIPVGAVGFTHDDVSDSLFNTYVGGGPLGNRHMLILPSNTHGMIFDDTGRADLTPEMQQRLSEYPREGIVGGKFRVVGKKEIFVSDPTDRKKKIPVDAFILEAFSDDVQMPSTKDKRVVVPDDPNLLMVPYGANGLTQPSGHPIRGDVVDKTKLPSTLYHISVDADAARDSGVLRAGGNFAGLVDPQDEMVRLHTSKKETKQLVDSMKMMAEAAKIYTDAEGSDKDKKEALIDHLKKISENENWNLNSRSLERFDSIDDLMWSFFSQRERENRGPTGTSSKPHPNFKSYNPDDWKSVDPQKIGIVEVSGDNVAKTTGLATFDQPLVMGFGTTQTGEIRVYADLDVTKPETPEQKTSKVKDKIKRVLSRKQKPPKDRNSFSLNSALIGGGNGQRGLWRSQEAEDYIHEQDGDLSQVPEELLIPSIFDGDIVDHDGKPVDISDMLLSLRFYEDLDGVDPEYLEFENRRFKMALVKSDPFYSGIWAVWRVEDKNTGKEYFIKSSQYGQHDAMLERLGEEIATIVGFGREPSETERPVNISQAMTLKEGGYPLRWTISAHVGDVIPDLGPRSSIRDFVEVFQVGGPPITDAAAADIGRIAVMDFLLDNEDRHGGNMLHYVDRAGRPRVFPIDHGLIFGGRANAGVLDRDPLTQSEVDDLVDAKASADVADYILNNYGNSMRVALGDIKVDEDTAMEAARETLDALMAIDPDEFFNPNRFLNPNGEGVPLTDAEKRHLEGLKQIFIARRDTLASNIDQLKVLLNEPQPRTMLGRVAQRFGLI